MLTLEEIGVNYTIPDQNNTILDIFTEMDKIGLHPEQHNWNDYWKEFNEASDPTYFRRTNTFRYNGKYIEAPVDTEAKFNRELKNQYFLKYFFNFTSVVEYGCGSGSNLKILREILPKVQLYAVDWAPSAVELVSNIAKSEVFDMKNPSKLEWQDDLKSKIGVLTSGSMEQLGEDYNKFLNYMLELKADVYLHFEPIIEFYEESTLYDYTALTYHKKRNYLGKFLTTLESIPNVEIIEKTRTGFGSKWNEGYNTIIWKLK